MRLVLSIIGGMAVMIFVTFYTFTAMSSQEQDRSKLITLSRDHWHQLHYKRILDSRSDTKEWTLGTKYGVIHVSENKKENGMKDLEALGAVRDAGHSESLLYFLTALLLVVTGVFYINRRRITQKNPYLLKALLFILPIIILGTVIGSVQGAARAGERAEKVFLEMEK